MESVGAPPWSWNNSNPGKCAPVVFQQVVQSATPASQAERLPVICLRRQRPCEQQPWDQANEQQSTFMPIGSVWLGEGMGGRGGQAQGRSSSELCEGLGSLCHPWSISWVLCHGHREDTENSPALLHHGALEEARRETVGPALTAGQSGLRLPAPASAGSGLAPSAWGW